jgi:hypothetical protein
MVPIIHASAPKANQLGSERCLVGDGADCRADDAHRGPNQSGASRRLSRIQGEQPRPMADIMANRSCAPDRGGRTRTVPTMPPPPRRTFEPALG